MNMFRILLAVVALGAAAPAVAGIVEPFDGGMRADWSQGIGAADPYGLVAPDGGAAWALSDATWAYNSVISFSPGHTLSAWFNPNVPTGGTGGRVNLGFGADASGAYSFYASSDTTLPSTGIGFQNNAGYGGTDLSAAAFSFQDQWYELTIDWAANGVLTGELLDSNGTTVLASLAGPTLTGLPTGIALQGFGGVDVADISVPEPASLSLLVGGILALRAARRRA